MSKALYQGRYTAIRTGRIVTLTARGFHRKGGRYHVLFERMASCESTPVFSFFEDDQDQRGNPNVLEPFEVSTMFDAGSWADRLVVHDAKGQQVIAIQQGCPERREAPVAAIPLIA